MRRYLFAVYVFGLAIGCDDESVISSTEHALTTTYLTSAHSVYDDTGGSTGGGACVDEYDTLGPGLTQSNISLQQGDGVYLYARGEATAETTDPAQGCSGDCYNQANKMQVRCCWGSCSDSESDEIHTGQNHVVPDSTARWWIARMLFVAPLAGTNNYTCQVRAIVYPEDDCAPRQDRAIYQPGATKTFLERTSTLHDCDDTGTGASLCARWGTENDAVDPTYGDGIYVGPNVNNPFGNAGYILRSPRFEVPATVSLFNAYSEVALTSCYPGTASCPDDREGTYGTQGSTVGLRLVIQQMCSPTSGTVGHVTNEPAVGNLSFPISHGEHHKKAHVVAYDVAPTTDCLACAGHRCSGQSFKVKTYIVLTNYNDVKVELGNNGTSGLSTGFAYGF